MKKNTALKRGLAFVMFLAMIWPMGAFAGVDTTGSAIIPVTDVYKRQMLGTGAKVIQGIHIGENTMIGAGAVVISNIPANCTAVGVPAKVIKYKEVNLEK